MADESFLSVGGSPQESEAQRASSLERDLAELSRRYAVVSSEAERLNRDLTRMKRSLSWRLTSPLRKADEVLRSIFGAVRFRTVSAGDQSLPVGRETIEPNAKGLGWENFAFQKTSDQTVDVLVDGFGGHAGLAIALAGLASDPSCSKFRVHVIYEDCSDSSLLGAISGVELVPIAKKTDLSEFLGRYCERLEREHLVFIGNGCQVSPGCVEAIVGSVRDSPDTVAIAGARVRDPSGRLAQCLGLCSPSGKPLWVGVGDEPDHPRYRYMRNVDFVSPWCFATSRALLGNFGAISFFGAGPEAFAIKLAEDAATRGRRVVFNPFADAVVFTPDSGGWSPPNTRKATLSISQSRLSISSGDVRLAERGSTGNKGLVAVMDGSVPRHDQDAGSLRMYRLVVALKEMGYHAVFLPVDNDRGGIYGEALEREGVQVVCAPHDDFESWLVRNGSDLRAVILSRLHVAKRFLARVRRLAPHARIVFDTVDLHFLREGRQAELVGDPLRLAQAKATRRAELAVAKSADVTLVVSAEEVKLLATIAPRLTVRLLSNIHEPEPSDVPFQNRRGILFVGGFAHEPNVDAVLFFANEIFPLIKARMPDAEFFCVGSWPTDQVKALASESIHVTGFVPDLKPFFDRCKLSVAPLRYGAGVKGKVNQSMALGLPVVGTTLACEGMWLTPGKDVLLADAPEDFARAVVRLHNDEELWKTISLGGLDNIRNHFSTDAAKAALRSVIEGDVGDS